MYKENAEGTLYLLNYTDKCTYEKHWVPETLGNRGNVYEKATDKLVACSFSKFFNLGELTTDKQAELIQREDFTVTEKKDGSLGILYWYGGFWRMNTRGSFKSDQAIEGLKILHKKYSVKNLMKSFTYLVEIIYPEDRKIIDYGDDRELILIGMYYILSNRESIADINGIAYDLNMKCVQSYFISFDRMFAFQDANDLSKEGFVVRFSDGERVKIKSKRYFEIARILTNLSPLSVWKVMEQGKVDKEYLEKIPEEFRKEVDEIVKLLELKYLDLLLDIEIYFKLIQINNYSRKEIALHKNIQHKHAIFAMMDNKTAGVDRYIMKQIRPKAGKK